MGHNSKLTMDTGLTPYALRGNESSPPAAATIFPQNLAGVWSKIGWRLGLDFDDSIFDHDLIPHHPHHMGIPAQWVDPISTIVLWVGILKRFLWR